MKSESTIQERTLKYEIYEETQMMDLIKRRSRISRHSDIHNKTNK